MKRISNFRKYCKSVAKSIEESNTSKEKLDFSILHHVSKVPSEPVKTDFIPASEDIEIDTKTIHLLERLSLVNLDGKAALNTLHSSIQFAVKIENICTKNQKPLYTVLEEQPLNLRVDQVTEGNCREAILQNSKITDEDYFISPPGNIPLQQEQTNIV